MDLRKFTHARVGTRFSALVLLVWVAQVAPAYGGGLFYPGHGVRGLGRAGAFVAGGDDPGGIWYNPANIGSVEGYHVLVDASMVLLDLEYRRVDSGGNVYDPVHSQNPYIPIPTVGFATQVWKDRLAVGISISAPYGPLPSYPQPDYNPCDPAAPKNCVDTAAQDAPQRYSLISQMGTLFLQLDLAVAWRVVPQLTLGVSLQNMFVEFRTLSVISSYNGFTSGPEDPEFDVMSELKLVDMFNPSAKFGVLAQPTRDIRIGLSIQLPFSDIGGEAETNVRLPVSPLYTMSSVEGSTSEVELTLPMVLRLGVEIRMIPNLRVEAGVDWQHWSVLEELRIRPQDIYVHDIPGIDRYKIPEMVIQLMLKDTFAVRLGGEYFFEQFPLVLRAGYCYESGAVEDQYAAVLASDPDKHLLSVGASYTVGGFRLDVVYAHLFMSSRSVDFRTTKSMQVNAINPSGAVPVGGGSYTGSSDIFGLGVSKSF